MILSGPFVVGKWVSLTECTWPLLGLLRAGVLLHGHARPGRIMCGFWCGSYWVVVSGIVYIPTVPWFSFLLVSFLLM